ncbi:hypothetical protein ABEV46_08990, partial [Geobacillus stearothermophilus]|uniref:hypothetical protein n=1 Tax=Geobacillus stearothermophilus TaxID=1422 RepID=UPI003D19DEAB
NRNSSPTFTGAGAPSRLEVGDFFRREVKFFIFTIDIVKIMVYGYSSSLTISPPIIMDRTSPKNPSWRG